MIIGLFWQFVLSLIIVYQENGDVKWHTIKKRIWYNKPLDPNTGEYSNRLFLWVIPFIALSFALMFIPFPDFIGSVFPFVKDLPLPL